MSEYPRYEIVYYNYGMTPIFETFPIGTTEAEAIEMAKTFKDDPHRGFSSLREVRYIDV